jgi:ribosomal protein L24E
LTLLLVGWHINKIMYGYIHNIADTPKENKWTQDREIELNDGSIVYGLEGDFEIEQGKGEMFSKENFLVWLSENRKQEEIE